MKLRSISATELVNLDQIVRIKEHFVGDNATRLANGGRVEGMASEEPNSLPAEWRYSLELEGIGG